MPLAFRSGLLVVAVLCGAAGVRAQERIVWQDAPLELALAQLSDAAGIDFVFAHRHVEGRRVSGSFRPGENPERALAALLTGTGLRAARIRKGQYVLIAEPLNVPLEPDDPAAFTGTLEGRVLDADTGLPLEFAPVELVDLRIGDLTDADGYFAIPDVPTGEYAVRVSYVGYRAVRVRLSVYPASPQLPPTIRLPPEDLTVDSVDVEGEVFAAEPLPGLSEIDARHADPIPGAFADGDLVQSLDWLPGLARAGEAGGELVVRGADPAFTRYLRDGVPVLHPWHTFGLFSAFQPEGVQRVRLHRGSLPPDLGGALAAVLELETPDGFTERPAGTAALSPVAARAVAQVPIGDRLGLLVAARRSLLDVFFDPRLRPTEGGLVLDPLGRPGFLREDDARGQDVDHAFFDAEAKLTWRPTPTQRLAVGGYVGGDGLDAFAPYGSLRGEPMDSLLALRLRARWGNALGSVRYRAVGRRVFVDALAYASAFHADDGALASPDDSTLVERRHRLDLRETGARVDADVYLSAAHELRAGARLAHVALDARLTEVEQLHDGDVRRRDGAMTPASFEGALYVQDRWEPSDRWHLQLGLRADAHERSRSFFVSPRLHARYEAVPERLFLRAGVSRQVQFLHRLPEPAVFTENLTADRWLMADDRVRPASAWQVGLGGEGAPLPWLSLSVDGFARRMEHILEPVDPRRPLDGLDGPGLDRDSMLTVYAPAEGRAVGLEVAAQVLRGPWTFGLSYAAVRSEVRVPGQEWRRGRFDRPHALGLLAQRHGERWSASARLTLQSGLPAVDGDGPAYEGRLPLHARLDLAAGYHFDLAGLHWDAQLQAFNLAGRRDLADQVFDPTASPLATDVRGFPVLPVLSLTARW
ncbi:MAG TPA: TonB-dependent receptor [Rubricoccaceae bacterium]|nr:TonB-dependent receptor [Rubricoccaceae bacterium]